MKYLQSINEFNLFKRKISDDDKIALEYINRLQKVKDVNPYKIEIIEERRVEGGYLLSYKIIFEDTPILIEHIELRTFTDGNWVLIDEPAHQLSVDCEGEWVIVECKKKYLEQLFHLVHKIYKDDINRKRINKINTNINPAADKIDFPE